MATIAMPLPAQDFDPTEAAITWKVLREAGHHIIFATPEGIPGRADQIMVDGIGLDPWSPIPGLGRLQLFGAVLRANKAARKAYDNLLADPAFHQPLRWDDLHATQLDALALVGGHRARGMRAYLESRVLQRVVVDCFASNKPVGAICHGVLLVARSHRADGRSVLDGRHTTALTWRQERLAARLAWFCRWWDRGYYRTYEEAADEPAGFMSVEAEVTRALASPSDFVDVPPNAPYQWRRRSGLYRDTATDARAAFVHIDGNYVSARWPGDAHRFATSLDHVVRMRNREP